MKYAITIFVVAAQFVLHGNALAGPYHLEILAEVGDAVGDPIDGYMITGFNDENPSIAINNDREVAFFAEVNFTHLALMTQRRFIAGAGKLVDGRRPNFDENHSVEINNLGQVVYDALLPEGGRGLFVDETFLYGPGDVIDGKTIISIRSGAAINDAGTVVFTARHTVEFGPDRRDGLFAQDRMVLESGAEIDGHRIGGFTGTTISNTGEIAVITSLPDLGLDYDDAVVTPDRIMMKSGDVIGGRTVGGISSLGSLTDNGDVVAVIRSSLDPDGRSDTFIITETQLLVDVGDVVDGFTIDGVSQVRLNNTGQLAFFGFFNNHLVMFAHDENLTAEGEFFDGKFIRRLEFFDMNDRGDVVFSVQFEDLNRVIVLATHIPEPSTFALGLLATLGLSFYRRRRRRAF